MLLGTNIHAPKYCIIEIWNKVVTAYENMI